jgi:hypothetical protein
MVLLLPYTTQSEQGQVVIFFTPTGALYANFKVTRKSGRWSPAKGNVAKACYYSYTPAKIAKRV